jgi:hypothetical protein
MSLYTATIAISVLLFIAIGSYAGRKVKNIDDYFVAGRRAPPCSSSARSWPAYSAPRSSSARRASPTTASSALPARPGIAVTGYIYGALFFGTFLRRSRAPTVADYFGQRFASHRVQQVAGDDRSRPRRLPAGGDPGRGDPHRGPDRPRLRRAVILAWLSYTGFTMYAGSRGVIITDTLMFLLFTGATCSSSAISWTASAASPAPSRN